MPDLVSNSPFDRSVYMLQVEFDFKLRLILKLESN